MSSDLAIYRARDPFRYQTYNKAQARFLRALMDPKPERLTVVLFLKPNRVGGSRIAMAALSAILFGTEHPGAACAPFGERWPFPVRSARLISTGETLGDVGPLQKAIKDLFPAGRYNQNRGVGKSYNSALTTDTGWDMDMMSYGQDALSAAGSTKGLIIMSEPPPQSLYTECLTRLGGNGLMIVECTQLDLAGWLEDLADDAGGIERDGVTYGALRLDGREVGEVRVVRGDIEDSCREHSNGHQSHSAIEAMIAGWPGEEREARKTGKPLRLSGRIYPNWSGENEITALPAFHQECWDRGKVRIASVIDPADRKPWACIWTATFPNDDVIAFSEWPPFDYNACKSSPVVNVEDYRNVILETEAAIGLPVAVRLIDGLFGAAIKSGRGMNIIDMLGAPCLGCLDRYPRNEVFERCKHRMHYAQAPAYDGSVRDGHILVRAAIGEPAKGVRPKFYAMREVCPNLCSGMRKYAYKENTVEHKGLSVQPQLVFKDFPDCPRMGYLHGFHKWPAVREDIGQTPTLFRGRAVRESSEHRQ